MDQRQEDREAEVIHCIPGQIRDAQDMTTGILIIVVFLVAILYIVI